ncbi:brassinosteroid-related acyltransferase 1 isoform X1 [Typha latifolia]|uniref:brassinosteroid-related acyltransferase 1 isoform X1 n=1 Tax=Typha latifolia TaxID=4733 RepID=UPI003C2FD81F
MAATQREEEYQKVSITRTTSVNPRAHPPATQETKVIELSNLDRKCPVLMYLVFFYRSPPPHHQGLSGCCCSSLFTSLKMGLEEVLSAWYPAAGRLSLDPSTAKLDLVCSNSGALFVEAATPVRISDLGDLSQYNDFYEQLVYKPPLSTRLSDMPLVVAQVTKFGCGGYAVGVGSSHSLFDGLATYNFLNAWASKVAGRVDGEELELIEPVHERERLLVSHGRSQNNKSTRVVAFEHLHQLIKQAVSMDQSMDPGGQLEWVFKFSEMSSRSQQDFVLKTFPLSSAMMECLKSKASDSGGIVCSSFEVVAAHLWKARTKALGIAKHRTVCLQFTVDTRTRMDPPLPKGFTGNAYVLSSISCTCQELENESLATIVEKIKMAKFSITEDYIKAYLEALEAPQSSLPLLPELTMISDWTRTPYHKVDFGFGQAAYVSPLAPPLMQVAYFMQRPDEAGGVDVRIGLLQEHVAAFSQYFLATV